MEYLRGDIALSAVPLRQGAVGTLAHGWCNARLQPSANGFMHLQKAFGLCPKQAKINERLDGSANIFIWESRLGIVPSKWQSEADKTFRRRPGARRELIETALLRSRNHILRRSARDGEHRVQRRLAGQGLSQLGIEPGRPAGGDAIEDIPQHAPVGADVVATYEAYKLLPAKAPHVDRENTGAVGLGRAERAEGALLNKHYEAAGARRQGASKPS
jgi:hypothetical protein